MKKVLIIILVMALVIGLVPMSIAMAAKPQTAIEMSNGMPSGEHETLLIHGKNESFVCTECDPTIDQCNVVNIPEYGTATIRYVSGRKVNIDELTVFDSCAGFEGENDIAEVWLPYEKEGYWVFMRTLGKPGKNSEERSIIFTNDSLEAYLLTDNVSNPDEIELYMGLGLITDQAMWLRDTSGALTRFDGDSDKGKGKSQGIDMTDMFLVSGFVFHPDLDVNLDGTVNQSDVIADNCTGDLNHDGTVNQTEIDIWASAHLDPDDIALPPDGIVDAKDVIADTCDYDVNANGIIDYDGDFDPDTFPNDEFEQWLYDNQVNELGEDLWEYYEDAWIFTIADLVYLNQVITNDGIKNTQIRFYPKATTQFIPSD